MQINLSVNLEKRHLIFVIVLVCVLLVAGVAAFTSPSTNVGHGAEEVGNGTFGAGDFVFPGNLKINSNFFLPINMKGIFWGTSESFLIPHINYDSANGLWISTGSTRKDVNVETTGKLYTEKIASKNITANNITSTETITLGGVARSTWPASVSGNCTGTYVMGSISPAGVVCKPQATGACSSPGFVSGFNINGAVLCDYPVAGKSCPTGKFLTGFDWSGNVICAAPSAPANPTVSCTTSLTDCADSTKSCASGSPSWASCPAGKVARYAKVTRADSSCPWSGLVYYDSITLNCCKVTVTCTAS